MKENPGMKWLAVSPNGKKEEEKKSIKLVSVKGILRIRYYAEIICHTIHSIHRLLQP
jgi:hypothetical protein